MYEYLNLLASIGVTKPLGFRFTQIKVTKGVGCGAGNGGEGSGGVLVRVSVCGLSSDLPPWDVWMTVKGSWHHDVAVFFLNTLGAVSYRLGNPKP